MKSFPAQVETDLASITPAERATGLVSAVDYCLGLRRNSEPIGLQISMALLEPSNLSSRDCEALKGNLEDVYRETKASKLSKSEYKVCLKRHGKQVADGYRHTTNSNAKLYSIGLAILMTRLSHRLQRLRSKVNQLHEPPSPYTRIAGLLRESLPHIQMAVRTWNQRAELTPEKIWSKEAMEFVNNSASIIAMTYPD